MPFANPNTLRIDVAVADILRSQPAPSSRVTYFASTLNNPKLRFTSWHLEILGIKAAEGTTTVQVRVNPLVATSAGQAAMVTGFLDETYELTAWTLKLLKSEPPPQPAVNALFTF